ncbi:hypothetical protein Ccar_16795 [Clostridium carboxidivorans P7]|uniref:hypothetical protein n=1 Tax=Clostridium carboxidivorans TaxID=217159 RepID=UPI00064ECBAA|nr:hypothetical protein [Clostridium carboxidivorans]AKN32424.1 hypothetical protein Ccar_16795 [Clostridium carboxidivorans P7]
MEYSQDKYYKIKLTKELIINLIENCLKTVVFKNIEIRPSIKYEAKNSNLSLQGLSLTDFKNETLKNTKFKTFSMVILCNSNNELYSLVLLKDSAIKDEIVIALTSHDKIWVDENLDYITKFLEKCNNNNIDTIFTNNSNKKLENSAPKGNLFTWLKNNIIGILAILAACIIAYLQHIYK